MIARLCILPLLGILLSGQQPEQRPAAWSGDDKEAALGALWASEIRERTSALADPTVHDYVEGLSRRLAAQLPSGDLRWEIEVIRDDVGGSTHEPLSIPGGHIFVSTSLILAVENEAELAGMLSHTMAHVTERHGTRTATRGQISGSPAPLTFIGGSMGVGAARNDDGALLPRSYLGIHRSNELEADRVATRTMAAARYDPAALLEYIRRVQRDPAPESGVISALPPRGERIRTLEAAAANLSSGGRPGGEIEAIQDRVRGLVLPSKRE
jgi:predicted Zn-dependent protease